MDLLATLEKRVGEYWHLAQASVRHSERQKYLAKYREAHEKLKKQRKWINALESL